MRRQPCLPHVEVGRDVARSSEFDAEAMALLEAHPDLWHLFVRFVHEARAAGRERLGAKLVIERIRWEHGLRGGSERPYMLNNNHTASLARIYCATFPEHADMFVQRTRPSETTRARRDPVDYDRAPEGESHV